jgi:hypothetical protein
MVFSTASSLVLVRLLFLAVCFIPSHLAYLYSATVHFLLRQSEVQDILEFPSTSLPCRWTYLGERRPFSDGLFFSY